MILAKRLRLPKSVRFFFLLALVAPQVDCQLEDTADVYADTAVRPFRGSNYQTNFTGLSELTIFKDSSMHESQHDGFTATDWFLQTSMFRKNHHFFIGEYLSPDAFDTVMGGVNTLSPSLTNFVPPGSNMPVIIQQSLDDIFKIFQTITFRETVFGSTFRLCFFIDEWKFGCDIPTAVYVSNLWTDRENQGRLAAAFKAISDEVKPLVDTVTSSSGPATTFDQTQMTSLMDSAKAYLIDYGVGDVRLYGQYRHQSCENIFVELGGEVILPIKRDSLDLDENLMLNRASVLTQNNFNSGMALLSQLLSGNTNLSTATPELFSLAKQFAYEYVSNFFYTLSQSKIKPQTEYMRFGFGSYTNWVVSRPDKFFQWFGKAKFNYLLSVDKLVAMPLRDQPKHIGISQFVARYEPCFVWHCLTGCGIYPGNFSLKAGIDYFYKSSEKIEKIYDTFDVRLNRDMAPYIEVKKGNIDPLGQLRFFSSVGYAHNTENYNLNFGIAANYVAQAFGHDKKDWGLNFSFSALF